MYCSKCGERQPEHASFCSKCGTRLGASKPQAGPAARGEEKGQAKGAPRVFPSDMLSKDKPSASGGRRHYDGNRYAEPSRRMTFMRQKWVPPVIALAILAAAGGGYGWYEHETGSAAQAAELHEAASKLALEGDYPAALDKLARASALAPQHEGIRTDRTLVETAQSAQKGLDKVSGLLDRGDAESAAESLSAVEQLLGDRGEPLFEPEKAQAEDSRERLSVLNMKREVEQLGDVDALASRLDEADALSGGDAKEVRGLIVAKIVSVSSARAEELLQSGSFDSASAVVGSALRYAEGDSALTGLQSRIDSERKAKEAERKAAEAEQKAEDARQQAAEAAEAQRQAEEAADRARVEWAAEQGEAEYAVQSFYDNLNMQNYSGAYNLLGGRWQKGTGYADFAAGYADTYSVWIDSISSARKDGNVEVTIGITAWEDKDSEMQYSTYKAVYQVGYENGTMKILSGKGEKTN
ncbi:zinc ribbon domain-containing protein [Saccharibacillus sp. CPCC 101409]|uniref:zinc ribbon domain-containing protein n=1 Tax=Saccharibacillus sp. CPCC 101409 TaxID=3058041 RepID=UPI0026739E64|nr:zinc ribbon domain-containing protein [Saccharibacillus sp. CPCC 101409]MDO3408293.1 zinc ribbon domain-containing protein [Saccharibacillus sp. CPCC 101409]